MDRLAAIAVFLLASATPFGARADPVANALPGSLGTGPAASTDGGAKTLKERLSDKASDEQRVNDCGVPLDRRGPMLRPGCEGDAATTAAMGSDSRHAASSLFDQGSASR
ncbi:MAG TPA: hypothetical protein VI113_01405 [Alphaproteobacteria bacterium]